MGQTEYATLENVLAGFKRRFASEDACRKRLMEWRWPEGFRCPRCNGNSYYSHNNRELYQCKTCKHQVSLTAGTIFHKSRTPLTRWFLMIYLHGVMGGRLRLTYLQRQWDVKNYKAVWKMSQKIQAACKESDDYFNLVGLYREGIADEEILRKHFPSHISADTS